MKLSPAGIQLIQSFEGCRTRAYRDTGGIWTIGWGHTGPEVHEGLVWTQEQCDEQFLKDARVREKALTIMLDGYATTQHQFDAMLSLGYNIGMTALSKSSIIKLHKSKLYSLAANAFLLYRKAGGKILNGLVRRRKAEKALYLTP